MWGLVLGRVNITPWSCIVLAFLLLTVPVRWLFAAIFAALVHEAAHYIAACFLGGRVEGIRLSGSGAAMGVWGLSPGKEAVVALAGPAGSFLLVLLSELFPELALCAMVQGSYNLLPIFPLDGGRTVRCVLSLVLGKDKSRMLSQEIGWGSMLAILILGIYFQIWQSILMVLSLVFRNISCNDSKLRVQ